MASTLVRPLPKLISTSMNSMRQVKYLHQVWNGAGYHWGFVHTAYDESLPREIFPENVLQLAQVLPLSHVVTLLQGLWMGKLWGNYWAEVGLLAALSIVFVVVSVRTFRWEPKN